VLFYIHELLAKQAATTISSLAIISHMCIATGTWP